MRRIKINRKPDLLDENFGYQNTIMGLSIGTALGITFGLGAGFLPIGLSLGAILGFCFGYMIDNGNPGKR
jgi:hypothetical protein